MSSADNLSKHFGPRSGLMNRQALSGFKLFDMPMVFLSDFFLQKIKFEKNQQTTKRYEKLPSMQWVNVMSSVILQEE